MQYLGTVHDGSENALGTGYWTCNVVATEVDSSAIVPLVGQLYSAEASGFISENHEILNVMKMVAAATKKRGMWVIDRGGDRRKLLEPMLKSQDQTGWASISGMVRERSACPRFGAQLSDALLRDRGKGGGWQREGLSR